MAHAVGVFGGSGDHELRRHADSRMGQVVQCVACGGNDWRIHETWQRYQLAVCGECGVSFTLNPDYSRDRYVAAYEGASTELLVPEKHVYVYTAPGTRLMLEATAFRRLIPPPRLTPAERLAVRWLKAHASRQALVVDCGCGTGRFLQGLARAGLQAVGVELSEPLVELLNRRGFRAVLGAAPDFPWDGPAPLAITFFEVLEHLPDPAAVITPLRERFPAAHILASVPSPSCARPEKRRSPSDYPPNHYVRWTPAGLERFFRSVGYSDVQIIAPAPVGSEMFNGLGQIVLGERGPFVRRALKRAEGIPKKDNNFTLMERTEATIALWILKSYQVTTDILGAPIALHAKKQGASAGSLFVIAKP